MNSTIRGAYWLANYGEISDDPRFRVGHTDGLWDAEWPIEELQDVIQVLQGVTGLSVGVVQKGAQNQARKVDAGFFTDVTVEPRLDTGTPSEIIRFAETALPDLIAVLQGLLASLSNENPDDWDSSDSPATLTLNKYGKVTNPVADRYLREYITSLTLYPILDPVTERIPVQYLPIEVEQVAFAIDNAQDVNDPIMAANVGTGGAFDTKLSARVGEEVEAQAPEIMASNPVVQAAMDAGITDAVENLDIGRAVGVQTTEFYDAGEDAPAVFAYEGDRGVAATFRRDGHVVWETEERSDLTAGEGVSAVFAYRDSNVIASAILDDGTIVPGSDVRADAVFCVAYGDSTTMGADLANPAAERWTSRLSASIGRTVVNLGASGARSDEIAWYMGALTSTGTVTGGSIPATGTVTITGLDIDPWRADASRDTPVKAITDTGEVITGVMSKSGTSRIFTRTSAGAAITTARLQMRATGQQPAKVTFLSMGINDEPLIDAGTRTVDDVKRFYQAVISTVKGKLIVWEPLDRGVAEAPGTVIGDYLVELRTWLAQVLGDRFYSERTYLASPQALEDAKIFQPGFTPTSDDLAAQAAGTVPPSFRASPTSVHSNALAHNLIARYFGRAMTLEGLI